MAKTGTSKRRGLFWRGKPLVLKPGANVVELDPAAELRKPEFIRSAILEAIKAGREDHVAEIMQAHLEVLNRTKTAKAMATSRQQIHRLIAGSRRPTLAILSAFMRLLKSEIEAGSKR